ncbi:hypothetical protein BsWGS_27919 [Bradybaena similaris]
MAANPYDPVTTTDSTNLTDEDWGLPVRAYRKYNRTSRLKSLCSDMRSHSKAILIFIGVVVVVLIIIIIIAATSGGNSDSGRHPTGSEEKWQDTAQGLVFYPVPEDKSVVISFTPEDVHNMIPHPLVKSLNNATKGYNMLDQLNESLFTSCNNSYTDYNKTCRVPRTIFGDECTSQRNYGYAGGQPCVFLQLNLPSHVVIKPIGEESVRWKEVDPVAKTSPRDPTYIPVSCRGTTNEDTKILNSTEGYGPKNERIMVYPTQGLLSYLYRERNMSLPFLKPAVMVHFTSLVSRHMVHITCTAWGQLYSSNGTMIDDKPLSTHFALYVKHP